MGCVYLKTEAASSLHDLPGSVKTFLESRSYHWVRRVDQQSEIACIQHR